MALILDGKTLALTIREKMKTQISGLETKPGLAVLLVGEDPASHLYVALKQKACEEAGIRFEKYVFETETDESTLIEKIQELNRREDIHGILVQLPLPTQNADRVIEAIDCAKDVDGFHPKNLQQLREGKPALAPAVALGIMKLIAEAQVILPLQRGGMVGSVSRAVIVSSDLFAKPLQVLLREQQIASTVVRPDHPDFQSITSSADILIIALGKPNLITKDFVKPGSILIDVGTTKVDGKLVGDIDRESVESIASALTPVPGGVGPMTVAMLLVNVLKAYRTQT